MRHEREAVEAGFENVAGIDEAGRGPLAGPVVAACVILKTTRFRERIADSKLLTHRARVLAYGEIVQKSHFGIGVVSEKIIDKINIYRATIRAMETAVENVPVRPGYLLIEGRMKLGIPEKFSCIPDGENNSLSIACASIIAKVTRDRIMCDYHEKFPQYGFSRHKGYGTALHMRSLFKYGPCPIHRLTFGPVKISK